MPSKYLLRNFEKGETYHLCHRGKKDAPLFKDQNDYKSFVLTLSYYLRFPDGAPLSWVPRLSPKALAAKQGASKHQGELPVTLHAFTLLPDHFHLLLTEQTGGDKPGISELMRRLSVGYAMTYRNKYAGSGTIYQGKYKMVQVPDQALPDLVAWLHQHPDSNPTYLKDPLHSSFSDYHGSERSWLSPFPESDSFDPTKLGKLTLD